MLNPGASNKEPETHFILRRHRNPVFAPQVLLHLVEQTSMPASTLMSFQTVAESGVVSSWSCAYMVIAAAICRWLEEQVDCRAFSRARAKTGKRMAANTAMIAMTTKRSMSVKSP